MEQEWVYVGHHLVSKSGLKYIISGIEAVKNDGSTVIIQFFNSGSNRPNFGGSHCGHFGGVSR